MQNVNTSNFTYVDAPIRATNVTNPYVSGLPTTTPRTDLSTLGTTTNQMVARPVNLSMGGHVSHFQANFPTQSRVIEAPARVHIN
jgi:hypothetical protein